MTTIANSIVGINGAISTDKSVLQNLQSIASAAGCWITYDTTQGKWAVVINRSGTSVASFDDSNIIGAINVSGKGINELYNATTIEFPHKDLRDQKDYVDLAISEAEKFPNEIDNRLNIATDLINDPIQAQYIANVELKQSRVDKVIQFRTDYSKIGLKAGDLIDVTAAMYGYTNKVFRITKLEESDDDVLAIVITALEYDANVYDTSGLTREPRIKKTGIPAMQTNTAVQASNAVATAQENTEGASSVLTNLAIANAIAAGVGPLFNFLKSSANANTQGFKANNPGGAIPSYFSTSLYVPGGGVAYEFYNYSGTVEGPGGQGTGFSGDSGAGIEISWNVPFACDNMLITIEMPFQQFILFPIVPSYTIFPDAAIITSGEYITDAIILTSATEYYEPDTGAYLLGDVLTETADVLVNVVAEAGNIITNVDLVPTPNQDTWYVPCNIGFYLNGNLYASKATNLQTSSVSWGFDNVPAGTYSLFFQPTVAITDQYQLFHGGYQSLDDSVSSITATIQCVKKT